MNANQGLLVFKTLQYEVGGRGDIWELGHRGGDTTPSNRRGHNPTQSHFTKRAKKNSACLEGTGATTWLLRYEPISYSLQRLEARKAWDFATARTSSTHNMTIPDSLPQILADE